MRRRFGRGRKRGSASDGSAPIDAELWLSRIHEAGLAPALEAVEIDGVSDGFAVLGVGEGEGRSVAVAFSPRGEDAVLAALVLGSLRAGAAVGSLEVLAVAPQWTGNARRRLSLIGELPFRYRAVAAPGLSDGASDVEPETAEPSSVLAPAQVAGFLSRPADRDLFLRTLSAFEGLAAKHGGVVRGSGTRVELVLLARHVASIETEGGQVRIETLLPERSRIDLSAEALPTALDRVEGMLRKRLNDRRVRSSEEGLRSALLPILEEATELQHAVAWPATGIADDPIDLVGLDSGSQAIVGTAREQLTLADLGAILDGALAARAILPFLVSGAGAAVRPGAPRLAIAAKGFDDAALAALADLRLGVDTFDVSTRRTGELSLERRQRSEASAPAIAAAPPRSERPRLASAAEVSEPVAEPERPARGDSRRRDTRKNTPPAAPRRADEQAPRFEEVSLFDLDDEPNGPSGGGDDARRRRGRGRRRGRRGRGETSALTESDGDVTDVTDAPDAEDSSEESSDEPRAQRGRSRRRGRRGSAADASGDADGSDRPDRSDRMEASGRTDSRDRSDPEAIDAPVLAEEDEDGALVPLDDVPEVEEPEVPAYEDEEDRDEGDAESDRARRERELRRRARVAKTAVTEDEVPRAPRRRAAFVAHADPVSLLTAVVLARDVRLVEGFWVYPQADLMTFFRSVATDLRDETPIFVVGFAASPPARDTFQAASLYRGRLTWFDHHDWPPEDLVALTEAIGEENVHIQPGADCSLASVVAERTRRSRFSDKLVELATARFTQHDYERWGRRWWHRAAEIAARPGERRSDLEPLLAGRPSDLAREASRSDVPPLPPELGFVSGRDFRIVHFAGFSMVVVEVPEEMDLHLAARIARERYDAQLSLALRPGGELLVLGGEEAKMRRGLDLGGMTAHLATKHEWIDSLPDDDHVARMRVRGLDTARLDEVITEIAMSRSIVEG